MSFTCNPSEIIMSCPCYPEKHFGFRRSCIKGLTMLNRNRLVSLTMHHKNWAANFWQFFKVRELTE